MTNPSGKALSAYVREAWRAASTKASNRSGGDAKKEHAQRSREFVECLGDLLRTHYKESARVFTKHCASNRRDFKLNELLFDIHVCSVSALRTVEGTLHYVDRALLQLESELARSRKDALIDFSKLVAGSASTKVFVGPLTKDSDAFRRSLLPVARACRGHVFTFFITPPADWTKDPQIPTGYRLQRGDWTRIDQD